MRRVSDNSLKPRVGHRLPTIFRVSLRAAEWCVLCLWLLALAGRTAHAEDEYERAPIRYGASTPNNPIATLQERLDQGLQHLDFDANGFGYLKSVLKALDIPVSSQTLVFSRTSLQRNRIAPESPRAIYFNDTAYVGFCQQGEVLELSVSDPQLGAVFYTLKQKPEDRVRLIRQTDDCLQCHGASMTRDIPGHLVRSVFPDENGHPVFALGSNKIDHTSEFSLRWGGWYVTGTHGSMKHHGNQIFKESRELDAATVAQGMNVTDLSARLRVEDYLSPHSDIVALMVLEHQTEGHNLLTRANFETRRALHYETSVKQELGERSTERWKSTDSRIRSVGDALVKYLLFSGEAPLTAMVAGSSTYAKDFQTGPVDSRGRSLREFDLQRRLFKYPCSYLVYSDSFDALPEDVRSYVLRRMWEVLAAPETSRDFQHLSTTDRLAIRQILAETKPGLPAYWREVPLQDSAAQTRSEPDPSGN